MGVRGKYVDEPVNSKWLNINCLHEIDSEAGSRIVMTEKVNIPLDVILKSLQSRHFKTDVLYPNNRDIAIYQTCPKLANNLFDKNSKVIIVRVFLFDRKSIKHIGIENKKMNIVNNQKVLERNFSKNITTNFTQHPRVKSIMTGLLAIPLSGKQKLLNDLINKRDRYFNEVTNKVIKPNSIDNIDLDDALLRSKDYTTLCGNMPLMNVADSFSLLLRHNEINPIELLLQASLCSLTKEFVKFNTKATFYEKGTSKIYK